MQTSNKHKMKKIYLFTTILLITFFQSKAQMGINKDGSVAHPSAMLDIKASSNTNAKGLLMPLLHRPQRVHWQ